MRFVFRKYIFYFFFLLKLSIISVIIAIYPLIIQNLLLKIVEREMQYDMTITRY